MTLEKDITELLRGGAKVRQLGGGIARLRFLVERDQEKYVLSVDSEPRLFSNALIELEKFAKFRGLRARIYEPEIKLGQRYFSLSRYLPGKSILWQAYSQAKVENAIDWLVKFHSECRSFPLKEKLPQAESGIGEEKDYTVLHGDYGRGNILFNDDSVSSVIDFENAKYGHPVLDVKYFFTTLLKDTLWTEEELIKIVLQKYEQKANIKISEIIKKIKIDLIV